MLRIRNLEDFSVPTELSSIWQQEIDELTDVQERAVRAGALDGTTNLLVVAPTSSGKTFVGEMAATSSAYTRHLHAIFVVPFKALAEEQYRSFKLRYGDLFSVVISTSDWPDFDDDMRKGNFNLAILTYEKLMGLLVYVPNLLSRCSTVVIDEVQLLGDPQRGPRLETLITQVLLTPEQPQIIALSSVMDEANRFDEWLNATAVRSSIRPVPLTQYVCDPSGQALRLRPDGTRDSHQLIPRAPRDREQLLIDLCREFARQDKQIVVFRSTIRQVEETANTLRAQRRAVGLPQQLAERLDRLDDTDAAAELRHCLASQVGFHTADMTHEERIVVEDSFRSGHARVLVATSTLGMGINLPSDIVIVADSRRFTRVDGQWRRDPIRVSDYRNSAGRAGRLGLKAAGEAILLAENVPERLHLFNEYVAGPTELVNSKIPRSPFSNLVFDVLVNGVANDTPGIVRFIERTFAYHTFYAREGGGDAVTDGVRVAVGLCLRSGLIDEQQGRLMPTQLGRALAGGGISLESAVRLADLAKGLAAIDPTGADLLFEVACCPEVGERPWPPSRFGNELDPRPKYSPEIPASSSTSRLRAVLTKQSITSSESGGLVRARCLLEWIAGKPLRAISRQFRGLGAAPARVTGLGRSAAWLLESLAGALQALNQEGGTEREIRELASEARYGVPRELVPLARLEVPGLPREALVRLLENERGVRLVDPDEIIEADPSQFSGMLTPLQVSRLQDAIIQDLQQNMRRRRVGHMARARKTDLPLRIVQEMYEAQGRGFEQAVADALEHIGVAVRRILRQPSGEEDLQLSHATGTIVVSVTTAQADKRSIRWNKAKEVLGTGAGMNPVNYVCIGRPMFDSLAERKAADIAREEGPRRLLLVPLDTLAEAVIRCSESVMTSEQISDLLASARGLLTFDDLDQVE